MDCSSHSLKRNAIFQNFPRLRGVGTIAYLRLLWVWGTMGRPDVTPLSPRGHNGPGLHSARNSLCWITPNTFHCGRDVATLGSRATRGFRTDGQMQTGWRRARGIVRGALAIWVGNQEAASSIVV